MTTKEKAPAREATRAEATEKTVRYQQFVFRRFYFIVSQTRPPVKYRERGRIV